MTTRQAFKVFAIATIFLGIALVPLGIAQVDSPNKGFGEIEVFAIIIFIAVIIFAIQFTKNVDAKFVFSMSQVVIGIYPLLMFLMIFGWAVWGAFNIFLIPLFVFFHPVSIIATATSIAFFIRNRQAKNLIPIALSITPLVVTFIFSLLSYG